MQISAETPEQLTQIISELCRLGVRVTGEEEVTLQNVIKAKVAPEGFLLYHQPPDLHPLRRRIMDSGRQYEDGCPDPC